jgi:hypothetical protein
MQPRQSDPKVLYCMICSQLQINNDQCIDRYDTVLNTINSLLTPSKKRMLRSLALLLIAAAVHGYNLRDPSFRDGRLEHEHEEDMDVMTPKPVAPGGKFTVML